MTLRLLGPVEFGVNGHMVDVGPPQRRNVLAALAVDAGRPVSVETLVERVWDGQAPDGARRALHAHIARIRQVVRHGDSGRETPVRLLRRGGEYLLELEPEQVDMHQFQRLVEHAGQPHRSAVERVAALREALALWQGAPLRGLPGQWAARVRERWRRRRLDVLVIWADAELRHRPDAPIVSALHEVVDEYPLAEPLVVALMRALHAAGRGAEAVDCYATTRSRLVEQLGIEPGPDLRSLHRSILRDDHPSSLVLAS